MIAKACIFDFDGVVMDSEKYHHLAWEEIAQDIGVEFSYEEYQPFKSAGRKVVVPYLLKKAGIQPTPELLQKYLNLRGERIDQALLKLNFQDITPGIVQFVQMLHKNNIPCAVASSSAAAHITAQRFKLFQLFDAFVDGETMLPPKPNPHLFLRAAELLQTEPRHCVVFEDSINGLLAAKNAQMHCVGIKTHFTDIADKIIEDFENATLQLLEFES